MQYHNEEKNNFKIPTFFFRVFDMSKNSDKINVLGNLIPTAEYAITTYLKDHGGCLKKELMEHALNTINSYEYHGYTEHETKPIHTLAWLLAFKELEREGVIRVERYNIPFPMVDNKSQFYLK